MEEDFDALWLYEPLTMAKHMAKHVNSDVYSNSNTNPGPYSWLTTSPGGSSNFKDLKDLHTNIFRGIPPESKKEKPAMGYNDNYRENSSQKLIDDAVREAIEAPRREAEINRRVALVTSLEPLATAAVGTVMIFNKKNGKTPKPYIAIKFEDDRWSTSGDGNYTSRTIYDWTELLSYLTTGSDPAEGIQVATGFGPVGGAASKKS